MKRDAAFEALSMYLAREMPGFGDRLPAERDLAKAIGCSRATLRAALDRLEQQGEIWRQVGQGTFRGRRPNHLPVRDSVLIEGATPADLMQARLLLEPAVAGAAARCASREDVAFLNARVDAGRKGRDRTACEQADDAFHTAIASVAGNPVLTGLMSYLSGARRRAAWQRQWDSTYRRLGVDEFRIDHSAQHAHVVDAIARGDEAAASTAMRVHLQTIEEALSPNGPGEAVRFRPY
ncbi:FadR/GntR family transcriptional regulator [Minwuia sp.]|uniref:FadR/GntR family transcriptional regulator n=1 Tax=Minwuia sp. TaxID=2493630 RepID=UPI003A8FA042